MSADRPDPTDRRAKRIHGTDRAGAASGAAFDTAHRIDEELAELLGQARFQALEEDLVRIIEARGGTVTPLPAPADGDGR